MRINPAPVFKVNNNGEMANKKNETLKKVFRLTQSRKIAEIEPDVTTFMRRMRYNHSNARPTMYNQQNRPNKANRTESNDRDRVDGKLDNPKKELIDESSTLELSERDAHMRDEPSTSNF